MSINPILIAQEIENRFRRYLLTTFDFPDGYADLRTQFRQALMSPARLFRGPYLHGLAPYVCDVSIKDLIDKKILPADVRRLPLLDPVTRPLYRHQSRAIERIQAGHNIVVSSGTGSGKTLTFLTPIIAEILRNPEPGVHALLLYPMNALVNDQLKNLRRVLRSVPEVSPWPLYQRPRYARQRERCPTTSPGGRQPTRSCRGIYSGRTRRTSS